LKLPAIRRKWVHLNFEEKQEETRFLLRESWPMANGKGINKLFYFGKIGILARKSGNNN
jgi:hypothetical protein